VIRARQSLAAKIIHPTSSLLPERPKERQPWACVNGSKKIIQPVSNCLSTSALSFIDPFVYCAFSWQML